MHHFPQQTRAASLLFLLALLASTFFGAMITAHGQPGGAREKKVFAHHMSSLNAGRGATAWHTHNPDFGNPATSNGGDYRNLPLVPFDMWNLTLEESADLQIRRAMRAGIDGFAVNAWAGGDQAKQFLDALFKVAEEKDYPFEISICPDPNAIDMPHGFTRAIVDSIKYLLDRHGDSPKLARRDGKPIIFGYQSNWIWVEYLWRRYEDANLVEIARTTPEGWELIKDAYQQIEQMVGQPLYFQFDMSAFYSGLKTRGVPPDGHYRAAQVVAKHLPALCEFLPSPHTLDYARAANEAGREWGQPVYLNYDNNRTNWAHGGPGSSELRKRWEQARNLNSTLIQFTTWNDYHENTNLSPGLTTGYAFMDLNRYYIDWWKRGSAPAPDRDRVYLFSRKYSREAKVFPFQAPIYLEGAIEVLTILPQPARIRVPGRGEYDAPAGLHVQQFPVTPGPVVAEVVRNNAVQLRVESPEPVTDRPFRQDNGIVASSSECARHWHLDFGPRPMFRYSEYGDVDQDGLPNWFEMYWFGKPWDFGTATQAQPHVDNNGDGFTNLQAFLLQRNPVAANTGGHTRQPYNGTPAAIPGRIEAERFDFGGPNVAYSDSVAHNQGGRFRPSEHVDIEASSDTGGGYNIGWTTAGEWLEYTVDVSGQGTYDLKLRVASPSSTGRVRVLLDGQPVSNLIQIPNTGGWQSWQTVTVPATLNAGRRILRLSIEAGGFNLNYIEFEARAVNLPPTVSLIAPAHNSLLQAGGAVELAAQAADPDGAIARVEFLANGAKIGEAAAAPYRFSWSNLPQGTHVVTARAIDIEGLSTVSAPITLVVEQQAGRAPFHAAPVALPGLVRAAEFDRGGHGVAYHDTTPENQGRSFRLTETVDLEPTTDEGGGFNVGWVAPGEWLLYTVDVAQAGRYNLRVRVASPESGRAFRICFDGQSECRIQVPNTGGWQRWQTVTIPDVSLQQGRQTMRITFDSSDVNVNFVQIEPATAASPVTLDDWRRTHFTASQLADAAYSGDAADPYRTGVPNLLAYALNRAPAERSRAGLPQVGQATISGQTYLTLTYRRAAALPDVAYDVEVSSDLGGWQKGPAHVVPVSVTRDGADEIVVVRDAQPLPPSGSRFLRLRVRKLP